MTSNLRWQVKKLARKSVALGSCVTGYVPVSGMRHGNPHVRVLTYHRFGPVGRDPFCVAPKDFEAQMAFLAEHRLAISLMEFEEFITGKITLRPGAVLVTIDDGFRSVYTRALPILKYYAVPAVAFITSSLIHPRRANFPTTAEPEDYLTGDELALLVEAGVAVGSHAWTHRSLGRMSEVEVEEQAIRSRQDLRQHLGRDVTAFAYPFGTRADFNDKTAAILGRAGYRCAFTSQHGAIRPGMDAFCLPRVKVEGGDALWLFELLVRGGMDNWRWIDRALWQLQASERG